MAPVVPGPVLVDGLSAWGATTASVHAYGSWLPFFYTDKKRTFFVLPSLETPRQDDREKGSGHQTLLPGHQARVSQVGGLLRGPDTDLAETMSTSQP